jgi:hypothetical protein
MLGKDGNIMDGEYSPSLRCLRRWKYSGWGALPIIPAISVLKSCSTNGERSPLPLPMSTKKLLYRWEALLYKWGALPIAFAHVNQKVAL